MNRPLHPGPARWLLAGAFGLALLLTGAFLWWSGAGKPAMTSGAPAERANLREEAAAPAPLAGVHAQPTERVSLAAAEPTEALERRQDQATPAEGGIRVSGRVLFQELEPSDIRVRLASAERSTSSWENPSGVSDILPTEPDWPTPVRWRREALHPLITQARYELTPEPGATRDRLEYRVELWWALDWTEERQEPERMLPIAFSQPFLLPVAGDRLVEDLVAAQPVIVRARADARLLGANQAARLLQWTLLLDGSSSPTERDWLRRPYSKPVALGEEMTFLLPPKEAGRQARVLAEVDLLRATTPERRLLPGMNDFGTLTLPVPAWIRGQVRHLLDNRPVQEHPVTLRLLPAASEGDWATLASSSWIRTDEQGKFSFGPLSDGRYLLRTHRVPGAAGDGNNHSLMLEERIALAQGETRELLLQIGQPACKLTVRLQDLPPDCRVSVLVCPEGGSQDDLASIWENPAVVYVDPEQRTLVRSGSIWSSAGNGSPEICFADEWGPSSATEATLTIPILPTQIELQFPSRDVFTRLLLAPEGTLPSQVSRDDATAWMKLQSFIVEAGSTSKTLIGLPPGTYSVRRVAASAYGTETSSSSDEEWTVEVR